MNSRPRRSPRNRNRNRSRNRSPRSHPYARRDALPYVPPLPGAHSRRDALPYSRLCSRPRSRPPVSRSDRPFLVLRATGLRAMGLRVVGLGVPAAGRGALPPGSGCPRAAAVCRECCAS